MSPKSGCAIPPVYHHAVISDVTQILNEGKPASQRTNLKRAGENRWLLEP
jgi:hypothetical protein